MGEYKHSDIKGNPEKAREKGRLKKGHKHKTTIVKEKFEVKEIEDLKQRVLDNFSELSKDKDKQIRILASKELAKYIFPQKRQVDGSLTVDQKTQVTISYEKKTEPATEKV